ncbi:MAG TPA: hypothetical protein VGR22_10710 [Thermomicrobiales bacterium]|nr:hypothetical protein [Thermomicrobiales bacterium]
MTASAMRLSRRGFIIAGAVLATTTRLGIARTLGQASDIDLVSRLGELLAAVPARDLTVDTPISFYYADLAGQLDALGIRQLPADRVPDDLPEGFVDATYALPLASRAYQFAMTPAWLETFGFSPLAVEQILEIATPPGIITLFAGGYERDRVGAALASSGYTEVLQEIGVSYWTFGDDVDLTTSVGQLGGGTMNQAVVSDDLLIFARQESDIQRVTWTRAGYEPSMLEQGIWTGMMSVFSPDTVGLIPLAPTELNPAPASGIPLATPVTVEGRDSGIEYLALGIRPGGRTAGLALVGEGTPEPIETPEGTAVPTSVEVRIRYTDPALAEREAAAIPDRWASMSSLLTGQPYTDLMTVVDARVHEEDAQVVAIDFTADVPNVWIRLIHTLDLLPFIPAEG